MNLLQLAGRGLRFHLRAYLGVLLGAALATAIVGGALVVGDTVRDSLRRMGEARLGRVELAWSSADRFFRAALADGVADELDAPAAAVVALRATALGQKADGSGGELRAGRVQVYGVDDAFWALGARTAPSMGAPAEPGAVLNDRLARAIGVRVGDEVVLRVEKPSLLSRDAPLSKIEDATVAVRLPVAAVVGDDDFGRFSLAANQVPPLNVFVPRAALQKAVGVQGRANLLLVGRGAKPVPPSEATRALWKRWSFDDAGLELRPTADGLELRTTRVFLEPQVGKEARAVGQGARGVLTYFVNSLKKGSRATPYSTVAAMEGGPVPADLRDDEIVVNDWLAADIGARVGDRITLAFWTVGPLRRLEQKTADFRIRQIVPLAGAAADPALMPDIPGLSDKKDCRDWEPGVPIDLEKIRDKDQSYWSAHRGTPKGFITLAAGQRIWQNRFGDLTAVRYAAAGPDARQKVSASLRQAVNPGTLGVFFTPVRQQAAAASSQSMDFGQLFLGLSLFLIVAALLLTALLFALCVEQRAGEAGMLLAVGLRPAQVRRLFLLEGALVAAVAGVAGVLLAIVYARGVVAGLAGVWRGAVADASLGFHFGAGSLAGGAVAGFLMALLSIWLVARRQAAASPRELLGAGAESQSRLFAQTRTTGRLPGVAAAAVFGTLGVLLAAKASVGSDGAGAGYFFGAGACLLIAGLAATRARFAAWERRAGDARLTLASLGGRSVVRRSGRSLAAVALFACGSFLVVAVGANRHDTAADAFERGAGTGGFAFYGETSLPVFQDLNRDDARENFGLEASALEGVEVVALRVREGDDASCLNLNRAQEPRLLGVDPQALARRKAFGFAQGGGGDASPWSLLERPADGDAIPVIGDVNTVVWSLGKKLGDTLTLRDDSGAERRLKIVAVMGNGILQGSLVLSEAHFLRLFPGRSGYQAFLVDAPKARAKDVGVELTRGLEDVGLSLESGADRLAAFNTVENTYLSIFAALGSLGLLLGSAGLGVIVLRNVLERRGELALLRAVGFTDPMLRRLVFTEHALLLTVGLGVGVVAALVAVWPSLAAPGAQVPYRSLGGTLAAVFAGGLAWVWIATGFALRGRLFAALRDA